MPAYALSADRGLLRLRRSRSRLYRFGQFAWSPSWEAVAHCLRCPSWGQNAKYSEGADNFRFAAMNGHHQARAPCRKSATLDKSNDYSIAARRAPPL